MSNIKFNYIAAWKDWSRQKWSLTAQNEKEARAKLHSMWFSVLKITTEWVTNIKHNAEDKLDVKKHDEWSFVVKSKKFEFFWFKKLWDEVDWVIEAKNIAIALQRLYSEFHVDVSWIVEKDLSPAIKEHKKKWSVEKIINDAFDEWIEIKKPNFLKKDKKEDIESSDVSKEVREELEKDVKRFIILIKELLPNSNWVISWTDLSDIKKALVNLEKIQKSNNTALIQSELKDVLVKIDSFFNEKNKEDLPDKTLEILDDIRNYIWWSWIYNIIKDKIIPFLEKFSFLKKYVETIKKHLEVDEDDILVQKKENLKRSFRRAYLHWKHFILAKDKEEREKRLKALKKSFRLIFISFESYYDFKKKLNIANKKFEKKSHQWNKWLYQELRFITFLILWYYFIYFIFIDFWIRKWIFMNYELWYFTVWSGFIMSLIFLAFLVNFMSWLKIKYFLKNVNFNIFIWWPIFLFLILFYYLNY